MQIDDLLTVEEIIQEIAEPLRLTHGSASRRVYRAIAAGELQPSVVRGRVRGRKYFFTREAVTRWFDEWLTPQPQFSKCG